MVKALRSPVSERGVSAPRAKGRMRCSHCHSHMVVWFQCWQWHHDGTDIWYLVDDYRCLHCGEFVSLKTPITIVPPSPIATGDQLSYLL